MPKQRQGAEAGSIRQTSPTCSLLMKKDVPLLQLSDRKLRHKSHQYPKNDFLGNLKNIGKSSAVALHLSEVSTV